MPKRLRMHVNPFGLESLKPREAPLPLPSSGPLEVELGCGDGLFMVERAMRDPEVFFVGIDIRDSFLAAGRARLAELSLPNLALETANLIVDLPNLFPASRVRRFFINFPDPFFKRRQHHRRWLNADAVESLVMALQDGGEIIYQSDVWEPTIEALALFSLHRGLQNDFGEFSFAKERLVHDKTSREKACERQGRTIWRMRFSRRVVEGEVSPSDDGCPEG